MGLFDKRRQREQAQQEKIAQLETRTAELQAATARLRTRNTEILARERVISKLFSQTSPQGSMTSDLYAEAFPSASKSQGALSLYRSHWSSSNDHLRRLSRIAAFESPTGAALIGRLTDVVVGAGLQLQSEPIWDLIRSELPGFAPAMDGDREARRQWVNNVEQRFRLWWRSKAVSYDGSFNGPKLDRQAFEDKHIDGEYFLVLRYSSSRRGSPLTIQIVPPENVAGGTNPSNGNTIENGIEYDKKGAAVAYHFYPTFPDMSGQTVRVPRYGSRSGRTFVIHSKLGKHRRGIPYLSNIIHELTKLGDYEVLEIQAAVINALFAVWVKPPEDEDGQSIMGAGIKQKMGSDTIDDAADPTSEYTPNMQAISASHGGIFLDNLPAGHELTSFDTKRPNQGFDKFFTAVKKNLAAAKGQPLAVVDLAFNNSYSGARGELLMYWMSVNHHVQEHAQELHDTVFKMWLWSEIDRGRIQAPGFAEDELLRDAYSNAQWIGNQRPDIDPMKSVSANILEQKYGYRTGHQITAERGGGDYAENLQTVTEELKQVGEAQAPLQQTDDVSPTNSRTSGAGDSDQ